MFCLDIHEYSPEWQEIKLVGDFPKGISRHSAVIWDDKIYCLGGENNNLQLKKFFYIDISDTKMNFGQITAKCTDIYTNRDQAPLELDSHTAVIYPENDNKEQAFMIVFGGYYKSMKTNRIFRYAFEDQSWDEVFPEDSKVEEKVEELKKGMNEYDVITDTMMETCTNLPRPRTNHTAVYYNKGMYIFGGSDESNNKLNDFWRYDFETKRWIIINHISADCEDGQPTKRSGHAASVVGGKMYIFGGLEGITHETNDFYSYDFKTDTWTNLQMKVANPEDIKPGLDGTDKLNNDTKLETKKSVTKPNNLTMLGLDSRYSRAVSPLSKNQNSMRKNNSKTRNNRFTGLNTDREKFSKTFLSSPLRNLLQPVVIPKKVKEENVEVNSPTTLALKSSIFLKSNDGFDHAHSLQKK